MYNQLIEIEKDGNVFLQDKSIALMPKLFDVYKHKHMGSNGVRWIVSMYDYKSPYRRLPFEERTRQVSFNIFGKMTWSYEKDKKIQEAIEEYCKLQMNPLIEQYNAMLEMSFKITETYKAMKPTKDTISDINKLGVEMQKVAEAMEKIKELILKNQESEAKFHGSSAGDFSLIEHSQRKV
jgi:hypothetical protein